jgi:hypothetical protein
MKINKKNELSTIRRFFWLILALLICSSLIFVFALRANNQRMVVLRGQVYAADKANQGIDVALNNLRAYVYGHMNTNLTGGSNAIRPPIHLKYTYDRLEAVEQQRVKAVNSQIYTDAQNYCQTQNSTDFSGRNRVPCVQDYVTSHGVQARAIEPALYQFDFVSPVWSPDLAGWSLVASLVLLLTLIYISIINRILAARIRN